MLKLFFTLILLSISTSFIFSQNIGNEDRIKDYLGTERFDNSLQNNPGLIKFLDVKIDKGYVIEALNPDKKDDFTEITSVTYNGEGKGGEVSVEEFLEQSQLDSFNLLFYEFPMPNDGENGYFILKGTGKIISVYSNKHLNNKL